MTTRWKCLILFRYVRSATLNQCGTDDQAPVPQVDCSWTRADTVIDDCVPQPTDLLTGCPRIAHLLKDLGFAYMWGAGGTHGARRHPLGAP